jgi:PAS domain S-box-containing protein
VKNHNPKHKITLKEEASGSYFRGASFLKDRKTIKLLDQIIEGSEEVKINLIRYKLSSTISEKLFVDGIDFIILEKDQLRLFEDKIDSSIILGLPTIIVKDQEEEVNLSDLVNIRVIDIISPDQLTLKSILRTQLLLQSALNANQLNFLNNLSNESFFESLFGKMEEAVSILDKNSRYIWINKAHQLLLGYSIEELIGRTPGNCMSKRDLDNIIDYLEKENKDYNAKVKFKTRDGKEINVELTVFEIKDQNSGQLRMAFILRKVMKVQEYKLQLAYAEERFNKFIKNIDDLITVTDSNGKISYVSPGYLEILDYSNTELINTLIFEYIYPEDIRPLKKEYTTGIEKGFRNLRYRFRKRNGEYLWMEARGEGIYDPYTKKSGLILVSTVIHDKLISEEKLKETESRYKILVERIYDLVFEVDHRGIIVKVIGNAKEILNRSTLSLIGEKFIDNIYKEDVKIVENKSSEKSSQFESRIEIEGRGLRWFEISHESFKDYNNNDLKIIILKDIHDKKKILKKIRENESLYRSLTENIQDIIIRIDKDLKIVYANSAAQSQLFDNNIIKSLYDLKIDSVAKRKLLKSIESVKNTLRQEQFEIQLNRLNKTVFYNWSIIPEFNDHSEFFSFLIVARNVTPFVVAKHEIKKLYNIIEHSTNSIIITDREGKIEYINSSVETLTGYGHHELIGNSPRIFKSGKTNPSEYQDLWETVTKGNTWKGTFCNKKKNGDIFWEFAIITPIKNFEGEIINYLAIKENITDHKITEETLKTNQEKLNLTLEAAQVGTWVINIPENIIYWDEQVTKLCGYTVAELSNRGLKNIRKFIHPEDIERVKRSFKHSMENFDILDIEFRVVTKLGLVKHAFAKGQVIRDEDGKPIRMDGISMDITSQKTIEDNLKMRNEELNQFVYKVSHDLRAPLASIRGIIELEKLQNKDKTQFKYLHLIEDRVSNLDQFMRNILSHSRNLNMSVKYKKIDFKQITDDCFKELEFLRNALNIKRIVKISRSTFYSDESRLFEIFRNLISNSIKYLDYDKTEPYIRITVKNYNSKAVITFEDNGVGIDPDLQEYIFDMFYRANEKSDGSGIGLYIVKQAVEKLNGSISVKSKKGEGTRFQVTIPNADSDNLN